MKSNDQIQEMTRNRIGVELMQLFVQHVQQLKKPWPQLTKSQQDDVLDAIREGVKSSVKTAVEPIAARDRMNVLGRLDAVTIKSGITANIKIGKGTPNLLRLFECQDESVMIVMADPGDELQGVHDIEGEDDQRGLTLGHEYKPDSDGEGMEGVSALADSKDQTALEESPLPEELTELYEKAAAAVTSEGRPSVSFVQRKLGIGYEKAKKLLDCMQAKGLVTAPDELGFRQLTEAQPS